MQEVWWRDPAALAAGKDDTSVCGSSGALGRGENTSYRRFVMQVQIGKRAGPWPVTALAMLALAIVTSGASAQTLFTTQEDFANWGGGTSITVGPTATD